MKSVDVIVIGPSWGGGVATIANEVVKVLLQCGRYTVTRFDLREYIKETWKPFGYAYSYLVFFAVILAHRPSIAYLQLSQTGYFHQSIYLLLAKILGVRTVAHFHAHPSVSRTTTWFSRKLILLSEIYIDRLVVLSESSKSDLAAHHWGSDIIVVPNFVDASNYPKQLKSMKDRKYILSIGRMVPEKGIFEILEIASLMRDHEFLFIGDFSDKGTKKSFLEALSRLPNAKWIGPLYDDAKILYMHESLALLLPSRGEVFPMTIIEASLSGAIPFVTPIGVIPEVIKDGDNGFYIEAHAPAATAKRIEDVLKDADRWETVSQRCRDACLERYTSEAVSPTIHGMLSGLDKEGK